MQSSEIAIPTWKRIEAALHMLGHTKITWQTCRGKYASMYEYFTGTLLRTGGIVGGVKCPYWDKMCDLHDFPKDYIVPPDPVYRKCYL